MSKTSWVRWTNPGKPREVRGKHAMTKRMLHWPVCSRCGLLGLKNDATRKALKQDCVTLED